jgi:predicted nucleic acid-binding protein
MTAATAVVADTQILIWYVIDPDRLSAPATEALEAATSTDAPIYVSAYSLVELIYAVERASNPIHGGRSTGHPFRARTRRVTVRGRIRHARSRQPGCRSATSGEP